MNRNCPACGREKLTTPDEAKATYPSWRKWGAAAMLEDAAVVCPFCKWVRFDGGRTGRLMSVRQRAWELDQSTTHDAEYWETELV